MGEPIWVTEDDLRRELEEVRKLKQEEDRLWPQLRGTVANVRRWEQRIWLHSARLAELRVRLPATMREYRRIRSFLLPEARARLFVWQDAREGVIKEIYRLRNVRIAEQDRIKRKRIIPPTATVTVTVYETETRKPIENAEVAADSLTASTDKDGYCEFNNLPLDTYKVAAAAPNYERQETTVDASRPGVYTVAFLLNPLPKFLISVVDSETGFLIVYLDKPRKGKHVWTYDEEKQEFIGIVEYIRIEYTLSVETEGHEELFAELTGWTNIAAEEEMNHQSFIKAITERLIEKIEGWFLEQFTNYTRDGTPIIPNISLVPDFTIQEGRGEGTYEGEIIQYFMDVTGLWKEKPRVLKRGIGYYTTDEKDPHFPLARVYVEYSHADEQPQKHAHKLPRSGIGELIDP